MIAPEILPRLQAVLPAHLEFLKTAVPKLAADPRIAAVGLVGSLAQSSVDDFSDIDLVVVMEPAAGEAVLKDRAALASGLGNLLTAFTGEHVGEPRLLVCLFGPPLLHVDLKFLTIPELSRRIEDPLLLWTRDPRVLEILKATPAQYPEPHRQWIEDRFWAWVYYTLQKIARGELFEAIGLLAFIRHAVLGPLSIQEAGVKGRGVRKLEWQAPSRAAELRATVATHDREACLQALRATVALYRSLRDGLGSERFAPRTEAERAVTSRLESLASSA